MKGFYFITDAGLSRRGNISDVRNALAAKIEVVQYREKKLYTKEMHEEALALKNLCKNITFLVNDRVDIALAVNADGVHLGRGTCRISWPGNCWAKKESSALPCITSERQKKRRTWARIT